MTAIARSKQMSPTTLLTKQATRAKVLKAMRGAAAKLKKGDLFFVSYSGHGGQVKDVSRDEPDGKDETWCLYDGELIDDELYFELAQFAAGVRILVLSDSCHSGTVTRAAPQLARAAPGGPRPRLMPPAVAERTYLAHKKFYDELQLAVAKRAGRAGIADPDAALAAVGSSGRRVGIVKKFKPAAILISGCQDNQTSMDGDHNGAFTEQLLHVWHNGAYQDSYARFHAAIKAGLPPSQTPNLFVLGGAAAFLKQAPFSV